MASSRTNAEDAFFYQGPRGGLIAHNRFRMPKASKEALITHNAHHARRPAALAAEEKQPGRGMNIDQDETGDYIPEVEERRTITKRAANKKQTKSKRKSHQTFKRAKPFKRRTSLRKNHRSHANSQGQSTEQAVGSSSSENDIGESEAALHEVSFFRNRANRAGSTKLTAAAERAEALARADGLFGEVNRKKSYSRVARKQVVAKKSSSRGGFTAQTVTGEQVINISTCFCHPIEFNHLQEYNGSDPCSFCSSGSRFFGFYGLGLKSQVEVIDYPTTSEHGYEETGGGHAQDGKLSTKMCDVCTSNRISILSCAKHTMIELQVENADAANNQKVQYSCMVLVDQESTENKLARDTKWCSICIAPAAFSCSDFAGEDCGLLMCDICNDLYQKTAEQARIDSWSARTRLSKVIRMAGSMRLRNDYPDGLRADVSFLCEDGELLRRMINHAAKVRLEIDHTPREEGEGVALGGEADGLDGEREGVGEGVGEGTSNEEEGISSKGRGKQKETANNHTTTTTTTKTTTETTTTAATHPRYIKKRPRNPHGHPVGFYADSDTE